MTTKLYYVTAEITDDGERKTIPRAWMVRAVTEALAKVIALEAISNTFRLAEIHSVTLDEFHGEIGL